MTDHDSTQAPSPRAIHHVRLTVTDIGISKAFYSDLLGRSPAVDHSDLFDDPDARRDPARLYAGCVFEVGDQLLGLRPVADPGDTFVSTRVGLDHLSLALGSVDELHQLAARLDSRGTDHGEVTPLDDMGIAILSVQDPDDINLELNAPLS